MTKKDQVVFKSLLTHQLQTQPTVRIDIISIDKVFWAPSIPEMHQKLDLFCAENDLTVSYDSDGRSVTFTPMMKHLS